MYCDKCENFLEALSAENEKLQNRIEELEEANEAIRSQIEKERHRFFKDRECYQRATRWSDNKIAELEAELTKMRIEKQISDNAFNGSWDDVEETE